MNNDDPYNSKDVDHDAIIPQPTGDDLDLTPEEEELLKRKLAEIRKRDPFIYR